MVERYRRPQHITPFPELIRERGELKWEVEEASPGESSCWIDKKQTIGRLKVPYGDEYCETCHTSHPHNVRQHELLHAKISPAQGYRTYFKVSGVTYDVPIPYIELAEEQRVHRLHRKLAQRTGQIAEWLDTTNGVPYRSPVYQAYAISCMDDAREYVVERFEEKALYDLMTYLFALPFDQALSLVNEQYGFAGEKADEAELVFDKPTAEYYRKKQKTWNQINEAIKVVTRYMNSKNLTQWSNVLKSAELIRLTIQKLDDENVFDIPKPGDIDMEADLKDAQKRHVSRFAGVGRVEMPDLGKLLEPITRDRYRGAYIEDMPESEGGNTWAKMDIVTPPLSKRLNPLKNKRKARANVEGAIPRFMHRYATDGAVFSSTTKEPGGTVLIDCSGSMALTTEQIVEIMEAAPAATIATYCGSGPQGELRIVAQNGKRVDERKHELTAHWGGNQVDFPALQWLSQQAEPRMWVSDGMVYAYLTGSLMTPWEECEAQVRKGKINLVREPEHARDAFLGKRKLYR